MPNEAMVLMNKSTCALKPWVYSLPGQELCNFLSNRSAFPTPVGVNRNLRTIEQVQAAHSPHPWG